MNDFEIACRLLRTSVQEQTTSKNPSSITATPPILQWNIISQYLDKTITHLDNETLATEAATIDTMVKALFTEFHKVQEKIPPERFEWIRNSLLKVHESAQKQIIAQTWKQMHNNARTFLKRKSPFKFNVASHVGQIAVVEMAKSLAHTHPDRLCTNFGKFPINNEAGRIKAAKIIAKLGNESLFEHFASFKITDKREIFRILVYMSRRNPNAVIKYLNTFNLTTEERIKLAQILAKKYPNLITAEINRFDIADEKTRFSIAKRAAKQDGFIVSKDIQNYRITNQRYLFKIATLAIKQNAGESIEYLDNYKIRDRKRLFELLEFCASYQGKACLNNLHRFPIVDDSLESQTRLYQIGKIAISDQPHAIELVNQLHLSNPKEVISLLLQAFELDQNSVKKFPDVPDKQVQQFVALFRNCSWSELKDKVSPELRETQFFQFVEQALKKQNPQGAQQMLLTLVYVLTKFYQHDVPIFEQQRILNSNFLNALTQLHAPQLRTRIFMYYLKCPNKNVDFSGPLGLVKLLIGDQKELIIKISSFKNSYKKSLWSDSKNMHLLLDFLLILQEHPHLTDNEKEIILNKAFNNSQPEKILNSIITLYNLKNTALSKLVHTDSIVSTTEKLIQHYIKKKVPINNVPNLSEVLLKASQEHRNFVAVFEYAASLNKLLPKDRKITIAMLGLFLEKVLNGTFEEWRSHLATPHLDTVFENKPDLREQWNKNLTLTLPNGLTVVETTNPMDLLLAGTEVPGSCLRVNGNPYYVRCLLGLMVDPKNKLIAIKNAEGKILSRGILHILDDENQNEPSLLLEKLYPALISEEHEKGIIALAKLKGEQMNLDVFSKSEGEFYSGPLVSHGGPAPYEYCDALHDVCPQGRYAIHDVYYLYNKNDLKTSSQAIL